MRDDRDPLDGCHGHERPTGGAGRPVPEGSDFGRVVGLEILASLVSAANDMLSSRWTGGKCLATTAPGMTEAMRLKKVKFLKSLKMFFQMQI